MSTRRTPKPSTIAKLAALALRLEVNILADGRSYVTVLDMTKGQGVPIAAVPSGHKGKAADAIVRALCCTPGILENTHNERPLTMLAIAKGDSADGCTLFLESAHATHEAVIDAANRIIDHLNNVRQAHAMALAENQADTAARRVMN